jgi:hypothetical protein
MLVEQLPCFMKHPPSSKHAEKMTAANTARRIQPQCLKKTQYTAMKMVMNSIEEGMQGSDLLFLIVLNLREALQRAGMASLLACGRYTAVPHAEYLSSVLVLVLKNELDTVVCVLSTNGRLQVINLINFTLRGFFWYTEHSNILHTGALVFETRFIVDKAK